LLVIYFIYSFFKRHSHWHFRFYRQQKLSYL
jgi:hypothetical protein